MLAVELRPGVKWLRAIDYLMISIEREYIEQFVAKLPKAPKEYKKFGAGFRTSDVGEK